MIHNVDPQLSQWDVGRSVSISDSNATHIHFANQGDSKAVIIEIENGSAKIPDYLLQTGKTIIAYAVYDGVTLESKSFAVRKRERPENYVYEEDQRNYIYELITETENAVKNANLAVEYANTAGASANEASNNANQAANSANEATSMANAAAESANLASSKANSSADGATVASNNANLATTKANTAADNANNATQNASLAASNANTATVNANKATESANLATANANASAENATLATNNANQAAKNANDAAFKAAHTAKSLMVIGKEKGALISLDDAIEQYLVGLRVFGKTTQNGTPTPDAPVDLVSIGDSGSIDVMVVGKNLLKTTANSATNMNGVSFTVNGNGSITANGTATVDTYFTVNESVYIGNGEYYLTGCPTGGSVKTYFLYISGLVQDFGNGVRSKLSGNYKIGICIAKDSTVSNLTFHPMIRSVSVADGAYEPHKGQILTVSTPNGLPGIPVTSGGNYTDANGQQWVCDEIDFARGVYVQRINIVGFENAVGHREAQPSGGNTYRFSFYFEENPTYLPSANQVGMCNALVFNYAPTDTNNLDNAIITYPRGGIFVRCDMYQTIAEFIAWAKSIDLKVQYALATPIETPLSEEELAAYAALHTYKEHTTVSNDAGAYMELEYVMDAKKYIDSLMAGGIVPATVEEV